MKRKTILFTLLIILLCTQGVQAMQSANFSLDWFTPLNSSGGGRAGSAHYVANVTIGQTAIGTAFSTNYSGNLGYWYGVFQQFLVQLPFVVRH